MIGLGGLLKLLAFYLEAKQLWKWGGGVKDKC